MSLPAREAFFDDLYPVYAEIFDGHDRAAFQLMFELPQVTRSLIQTMRTGDGQIVGFNAVRLYVEHFDGRLCRIFRSTAGMKREYRGHGSTVAFGLQLATSEKFRHPFAEVYYFGAMVHPSSFYLLSRYAHEAWPRHDKPTPAAPEALIRHIAQSWGLNSGDPPSPYVRLADEVTRETGDEPAFWRTSDNPIIRFYMQTNPRYAEGFCMLLLIPLTWSNLILSAVRFTATTIFRRLGFGRKRR